MTLPIDEQNAAIVASLDAAITGVDVSGTVRFWSAGAGRAYGYAPEEIVGRSIDLVIHPEDRASAAERRARVLRGGPVAPHHVRRLRDDGAVVEHALVLSPMRDASGAIVGVWELAHAVADPSLHEEAAYRLAAIVESSDDAIVSKDLDGIVRTWNRAAERIFGYPAEEIIGRSIKTIIPPERLGEEDVVLSKIRSGEVVDHFETVRRRKDGTLVDVSVTVSPVRNREGRVIGASKIARDITDKKRFADIQRQIAEREERARLDALEAENRRIQEASRIKSQFVANMSHELRTPLQAIIGFTELMVDQRFGPMPARYHGMAHTVLDSSRHLLQLINDVLDLAKIESGRTEFHPETIDVASIVREVHSIVQGMAAKNGVTIDVAVDSAVGAVMLDAAKLKQVLYNYLSNAIKFTSEGGRVHVRVAPEGADAFRIEVEDTGIGIPEEEHHRLFEEFLQLDAGTAKRYPGTGLGLALTRRIVEAQGGSVGFRSREGAGSTFFATLPRRCPTRSAELTSGADADGRSPAAPEYSPASR